MESKKQQLQRQEGSGEEEAQSSKSSHAASHAKKLEDDSSQKELLPPDGHWAYTLGRVRRSLFLAAALMLAVALTCSAVLWGLKYDEASMRCVWRPPHRIFFDVSTLTCHSPQLKLFLLKKTPPRGTTVQTFALLSLVLMCVGARCVCVSFWIGLKRIGTESPLFTVEI